MSSSTMFPARAVSGVNVSGDTVDLTIAIPTFRRAELLGKALRSCAMQKNSLGLHFEVLVIDNDPDESARSIVEAFAGETDVPMRYAGEPARNISIVRNACVRLARGGMIAFLDDDEEADPDWTDAMVGALRDCGADIAVGLVRPVFAAGKGPVFDPEGWSFGRRFDLPDRSLIPLLAPSGRPIYGVGTGNSLFDVARCFPDREPFNPALGTLGGEDTDLYARLYLAGKKIVWVPDGSVSEFVPEHRDTTAFRIVRARRETEIFARVYMQHATNPLAARLDLVVKGAIQLVLGSLIALFSLEFGSKKRLTGRKMRAVGLGKLALGSSPSFIEHR